MTFLVLTLSIHWLPIIILLGLGIIGSIFEHLIDEGIAGLFYALTALASVIAIPYYFILLCDFISKNVHFV